jgi:DNA-binding PucR family transcriptional regulator
MHKKTIFFATQSPLPWKEIAPILEQTFPAEYTFSWIDKTLGCLEIDATFTHYLPTFLVVLHDTISFFSSVLVCHRNDSISQTAIRFLQHRMIPKVYTLGEFLLERIQQRDQEFIRIVKQSVDRVHRDLRLTARAYLAHHMKVTHASNTLFVHRNTFQYRLQKFVNQTGLNLKDFDDAFFFKLADSL